MWYKFCLKTPQFSNQTKMICFVDCEVIVVIFEEVMEAVDNLWISGK